MEENTDLPVYTLNIFHEHYLHSILFFATDTVKSSDCMNRFITKNGVVGLIFSSLPDRAESRTTSEPSYGDDFDAISECTPHQVMRKTLT